MTELTNFPKHIDMQMHGGCSSGLPVGSFWGKGSIYLTGAAQTFSEHKLKSHCVEEMERQKITKIIFIRILIEKNTENQ